MTTLTLNIPSDWAAFEKLSLNYGLARFVARGDLYGRLGQNQHGVDAIIRLETGSDIGIQSKRYYDTALTTTLLQTDLDAAHALEPKLARYVVTTTLPRDTRLQDWARSATLHGQPTVEIWFWDIIAEWILSNPARKAEYLGLGLSDCAEIIASQLQARSAREIIAFSASADVAQPNESREVVESRALLQSGHARLALDRIQTAIDHGTHDPAAWRVAAIAHQQLGDPQASVGLLDRAALMGLRGGRFEIVRASALLTLGRCDDATRVLSEARTELAANDRGAVLSAWWSHCIEMEHLSYAELSARIDPSDLVYPEVHIPLANAAAIEGNVARTIEHVEVLERATDIDHCIAPLLRACAPIAAGERAAAHTGSELRDDALRSAVDRAVGTLEETLNDLRGAPHSSNRGVGLAWLARGRVLLGKFDQADQAFTDLIAIRGATAAGMRLIFAYASSFGRGAVVEALIASPATKSHPLVQLLRLEHQSVAPSQAQMEIADLLLQLDDEDEWLPFVLAAAAAQPIDPARPLDWIDRGIRLLPTLQEPAPLVLGLAVALTIGDPHPAATVIAAALSKYAPQHRLNIGALAHLVALFRRHSQNDLQDIYGGALDRAIDAGDLPTQLHEQLLVIHETLARFGLTRVANCMAKWFAADDDRRLVQALRVELAYWNGDFADAYDHLATIFRSGQATPHDVAQMTTVSFLCGKLHDARRLLRHRALPVAITVEETSSLAKAFLLVGLTQQREDVLGRFAGFPNASREALATFVTEMAHRRVMRAPQKIGLHTLARLELVENPSRQLQVWITPTGGESAPDMERAAIDEPWIVPLLEKTVDALVTLNGGVYVGTWRVVQIQPGSAGLSRHALHRAQRIGLAAGGVDVIAGGDNPAEAIRHRLQTEGFGRLDEELGAPILAAAHVHSSMPLEIMSRFKRYRLAWGIPGELPLDLQLAAVARDGFITDPLTALLLENYGLLEIAARAAGRMYIAPQSRIPLVEWWYAERDRRHGIGSTALLADGRLAVQEFDAAYRKRGALFWREFVQREGTVLHVLREPFPDATGAVFAPLSNLFGAGMAVSAAYAIALKRPMVSIDAELVKTLRALKIPAISLPGLLARGTETGRITLRESAAVKGRLRNCGWTFVGATTGELIAVLNASDESRISDLRGLLADAGQADAHSAIRVVVKTLNQVGPAVAHIDGEDASLVLFKHLPPVPVGGRKAASSHVPAARKAWYKAAFWAWRRGNL